MTESPEPDKRAAEGVSNPGRPAPEARSLFALFLREQFGIRLRDLAIKDRLVLLEDVERIPCNLCGSDDAEPIAERDKYGLAVTSVMCRRCGLMYLNPRPTAASYRWFYESGGDWDSVYHRRADFSTVEDLLRSYYGEDFLMSAEARENMDRLLREHRIRTDFTPLDPVRTSATPPLDSHALDIYEDAKHRVPVGGKVFEVGASEGLMLLPWRDLHGCEVSGVEPKKGSVRLAKEREGIELVQGFCDDPRIPENMYDLVLNTRTINHQVDPLGDLRHAWGWLKPGGVLMVDIPDAVRKARWNGFEQSTVEIDHPYMFTLNTLTALVQKAGFEVVGRDLRRTVGGKSPQAEHHTRIRIFGRKSMHAPPVLWPTYETERADLDKACAKHSAQLEQSSRERDLARRERQLAKRARQLEKRERQLEKRERRLTKRERQLEKGPRPLDPELDQQGDATGARTPGSAQTGK